MATRYIDAIMRFIDNFTAPAKLATEQMQKMSESAIKNGKNITKAGDAISKVGKGLTAAITMPLAGVAVASVQNFGSVDKQLRLVQATMGSTNEEASKLSDALKTAAANSVYSMQDAADATLNFARQGFNAAQAADMITPALNLAAGTGSNLSDVTSTLGNTLKAFGADSSQATHYVDMFARAQAQANTDVQGLSDMMRVAGSTAKTVGWSFSDLGVLTGAFGDAGIAASDGATALNTGLMRLASPSRQAEASLKRLGISAFDANGNLRSMPDLIGRLQQGFSGLSQEEQLAAASAIFGKNQASKWMALINGPGAETLQGLKDNIDNVNGTAQEMSDALLSGVGGSIEKLKSTFDVFKYNIGSALAEPVARMLQTIDKLLTKFNGLDASTQKQIAKWGLMAAAIGPVLFVFGKTVSTIGKVVTIFGKVSKAIQAAGGVMGLLTSPAAIVIAVIAAVAVAAVILYKNWDKIKGSVQGVIQKFQAFRTTVAPIMPAISAAMRIFGQVVMQVLRGVVVGAFNGALGVIQAWLGAVTGVIESAKQVFHGFMNVIKGIMTGNWSQVWEGAKNIVIGAVNAIISVFKGMINTITSGINTAVDAINSISVDIPKGVPGVGGKHIGFNVGKIPQLASGTNNWAGGIVQVHERGGEIIDLPNGSRVYPHDESIKKARKEGKQNISIAKLADSIIVREDADIDKIATALYQKLNKVAFNQGVT